MTNQQDTWPAGATWVFQGTVAEDATGGTHVCTLTVTPGAGNEIQLVNCNVIDGNTATNQFTTVYWTDGTNVLGYLFPGPTDTTASLVHTLPTNQALTANTVTAYNGSPPGLILSGTMQLVLKVTTTAISVTQTFAVVCRIKGAMPTATLADTVGTPVLTVNTNKVF